MENFILTAIILIILLLAGLYVFKAKKSQKKCIGCPYCDSCKKNQCASQNCK